MAPWRNRKRERPNNNKLVSGPLSKKEKKHIQEFGEVHPIESRDTVKHYTTVQDEESKKLESRGSDESASEDENPYQELISIICKDDKRGQGEEISETESESGSSNVSDDDGVSEDDDDDVLSLEGDSETKTEIDPSIEPESHSDSDGSDAALPKEEDEVLEETDNPEDFQLVDEDPFVLHFERDLPDAVAKSLESKKSWNKDKFKMPFLGSGMLSWPDDNVVVKVGHYKQKNLRKLHVKHSLCSQIKDANEEICTTKLRQTEMLTHFQSELFQMINNYQDVYFPDRTHKNGEEIRILYCIHAVNHILKTRNRVIAHNTKLRNKSNEADDEYRDQGLTRPKVLIVLPFRDAALKTVNCMMQLMAATDDSFVSNKKRFQEEYGMKEEEEEKKSTKPDDHEKLFAGNVDDHFRIGIGIAKKTLKLYTPFYAADIIIASPLGLRTVIGAEGEKSRDYDFLSSIEVLIMDQMDVFLMQNWDHVLHLMSHMHLQPREAHDADFSRIRMWTLNGWSKFYRQTILLSSYASPEFNSLFNRYCQNYAGKVHKTPAITSGTISQITTQLPQVFQRVDCSSFAQLPDSRFEFFIKKVLPQHKDPVMFQTMIFIPSYFDFVRIRNYFVKEEIDFLQINEYSKDKEVSRSRNRFRHKKNHFLLFTERFYFYRRSKIFGSRHLIFYDLPHYPHFYSELCNSMQDQRQKVNNDNLTCTVMYSRYDVHKLANVVGTERAGQMINSGKATHMLVTGENS